MLNNKYIPLGLFTLYSLKLLILGGNLESAIVLAVLSAVSAFYEWKSQNKVIKDLEDKFQSFQAKLEDQDKQLLEVKSFINSSRLLSNANKRA